MYKFSRGNYVDQDGQEDSEEENDSLTLGMNMKHRLKKALKGMSTSKSDFGITFDHQRCQGVTFT